MECDGLGRAAILTVYFYSLFLSVAVLKRIDSGIAVLRLDYSVPGFHGSGKNVQRATPVQ